MTANDLPHVTHRVENQPPVFAGVNAYLSDPILHDLAAPMPKRQRDEFEKIGRFAASAEAFELARLANRQTPELKTHDARGNRIDVVEYHPAYHALMRRSAGLGLNASIWESGGEGAFAHQARAVRFFLMATLECGHLCPMTMTSASVAALAAAPVVAREWAPRIVQRKYDSANRPVRKKAAATVGMGMTEKQGGSDLRSNTSRAERISDGLYRISGHKWFLSAPMSDAFVMIAQMDEGPGCFLVPRLLEDGAANGLEFQRLKDKLGNRSNASTEVEIRGAYGFLLGNAGAGIRTALDMVTLTRLDCALASAAMMRSALCEAVFHTRRRYAFQSLLADQPLMQRVMADLALDVAAATTLAMRLAQSFDRARSSAEEAAFARVMTPVVKYWVCKIAPSVISETMECLGGVGYVEERAMARHYREAPVNAIWEGSGNVMALDVLRVLARAPDLFDSVLAGLQRDLGASAGRTIDVLKAAMAVCQRDEGAGRFLTEQLALAVAAAELNRMGAGHVADAFMETRLAGNWRSTYGMLDLRFDSQQILDILYPDV